MMPQEELQLKLSRFESFSKLDPENGSLLIDLGDLYHRLGRFDEAAHCFERALTLVQDASLAQGRLAAVLLSQQRFAEASAIYESLLVTGAGNPALLHNCGLASYHQGKFERAADCFTQAQAGGLYHIENWKYLAYSLHRLGKTEAAIEACEKWVNATNSGDSVAYLAILEFDRGGKERAAGLARQALLREPENADANVVLGSLALEGQEMALAHGLFQGAVLRRPDSGRAWLGMGLSLLYEDKQADAIDALSRAVECMPRHAGTRVALGWGKLIANDYSGAEVAFREAIIEERDFAESHGGLAVAQIQLGQLEEAKRSITIADRLDAANFGSVYAKALLLRQEGQSSLADRLIEKALNRSPTKDTLPLLTYLNKLMLGKGAGLQ